MNNSINKLEDDEVKYNNSKIKKILKYYYKESYNNFDMKELQGRIVDVNVYIQLIEHSKKRPEYKTYIKPVTGLPETYIKNPSSFFLLCVIHGFLPNIESIIIKNSGKKLDITQYKKFVLINRMLHLFFVKGFNFVLYDTIQKFLNDPFIKNLFEEKDIVPLMESEILSLVKIIEDIKTTGFDLNKHHFHDQLGKLNNEGIFSENMFLEVAMKYENNIRDYVGYHATYIKPASYQDDMNNKTDFNWIYAINDKISKYKSIPIQFTVSRGTENKKLDGVISQLLKSKNKEFIYLQVDGNFKKNFSQNISLYQERILNPNKRESQDPAKFPLFINHMNGFIKELLISYFYLHQIMKHKNKEKIPKLKITINGINLGNIEIKKNIKPNGKADNKIQKKIYSLSEKDNFIGNIILLEKK